MGQTDAPPGPTPEAAAGRRLGTPRTTLHLVLAAVWQDLLKVMHVGIHDDFFESGGTPPLAAEMAARIERLCGRALPRTSWRGARRSPISARCWPGNRRWSNGPSLPFGN